jgi:hypothetical protein
VKILRAFGVEIKEGETIFERKETRMVLVDGSETYTTVVRGTHGFCGLCLCVVPHLTSFAFSLFVIASSTNRDHALCLCENIRRPNQTQDGIVGNVSLNLVGAEAAWRKRLDFCKGAVFTELKAQGIVEKRPSHSFSPSISKLNPPLICYQGCQWTRKRKSADMRNILPDSHSIDWS